MKNAHVVALYQWLYSEMGLTVEGQTESALLIHNYIETDMDCTLPELEDLEF